VHRYRFEFSALSTKGHPDREETTHPCRSAAPSMARTLRSSEWPLLDVWLWHCFELKVEAFSTQQKTSPSGLGIHGADASLLGMAFIGRLAVVLR
jgi:hypothetical protein